MALVLNLNNEVVKMRKDVKKVKVLTIRRLTRNISKLKSKKGTEELLQKNQRRAQRLLEEIHMIKKLRPDDVTKIALQKELNFEKVCKKPNNTVEMRAIARLATHPLLKQKISAIKDAVKAFKEARKKAAEQEAKTEETFKPDEPAQIMRTDKKQHCKQDKTKQNQKPEGKKSEDTESEDSEPDGTQSEDSKSDGTQSEDSKSEHSESEGTKSESELLDNVSCEILDKETDLVACNQKYNEDNLGSQNGQKPVSLSVPKVCAERNLIESVPEKPASLTTPNLSAQRKPVAAVPEKQVLENKIENKSIFGKKTPVCEPGSDSSDIDDSDKEDKEYFDDSTEERFYKQSSGFEDSDSDSDNDFFIGKVRRTKKKKSSKNHSEDKVEKEKLPTDTTKPSAEVTESQKGRESSAPKTVKLESVFCNSLSNTKQKSSFMKREPKLPPVMNKKSVVPQAPKQMKKPQAARNSAVKSQSKPEKVLHPSWEASRKRKEQSQIAVFQGKKIVFDD